MGAVYKAKHVKVGRPFAVKVLHERLLVDPRSRSASIAKPSSRAGCATPT